MKNKILGIILLMAICLTSISVAQAGCSEGICCDKDLWAKLSENEVHTARANNFEYELEVLVISETSNEAKFKINGEITDALSEGEEDTLSDGSVIEVKKIITDESPSKVVICFDYGVLQCSGMVGELNAGETENYVVGDYEYEVEASVYKGNFRLQVNGEMTDWLGIGSEQTMADGLKVKILYIGSDRITFCMTPGPARSTPEQSQPENKIDLSNFPELFIKGKNLNGIFVVGDQAPADDVIAAIDISMSFQKYGVSKTGDARLASEVDHYKRNIISVGRPCDNAVTAQILRSNGISDYDSDCSYNLKPGQAMVYLFDYKGYAHMLVFGYSRLETRQMARALQTISMKGTKWLHHFESRSMPQPEPTEPEQILPREQWYCKDSDGMNEFIKGEAYGPAPFVCYAGYEGEPVNKVDFCSPDRPEEYCQDGQCLVEYFCRTDKEMGYKVIHCENGCKDGACIQEEETPKEYFKKEPPVTKEKECYGCRKNGACLQVGVRLLEDHKPVYCDYDNTFKPQKENSNACQNNYECLSNTCQDGICQSMGEQIKGIQKGLEEQKGILERILGFFKKIFG